MNRAAQQGTCKKIKNYALSHTTVKALFDVGSRPYPEIKYIGEIWPKKKKTIYSGFLCFSTGSKEKIAPACMHIAYEQRTARWSRGCKGTLAYGKATSRPPCSYTSSIIAVDLVLLKEKKEQVFTDVVCIAVVFAALVWMLTTCSLREWLCLHPVARVSWASFWAWESLRFWVLRSCRPPALAASALL